MSRRGRSLVVGVLLAVSANAAAGEAVGKPGRVKGDVTPPETTITSGPGATIASGSASFGFSSSEPGAFQCSMDDTAWASCSSPATYPALGEGSHVFRVRAVDGSGNIDATPASRQFAVDLPDAEPEPEDPPAAGCQPNLVGLVAPGCTAVYQDSAASADATAVWGEIGCASTSRHALVGGGDPHPTAAGVAQSDSSSRRLTVIDGDDVWGERCEIGKNSWKTGPTAVYREGQRAITFASYKLGSNFPLSANTWQTVMQMKQAQPSANGSGTPMLSLRAMNGRWSLWQSDSVNFSDTNHQVWSTPAAQNVWTRFALDITYSQDPSRGKVTIYVDLNGDGDAADSGEQSPTLSMSTLKRETTGGTDDGIAPGESIPSHLRVGIYHNPAIECPPPGGCSTQVDNVQVVRP